LMLSKGTKTERKREKKKIPGGLLRERRNTAGGKEQGVVLNRSEAGTNLCMELTLLKGKGRRREGNELMCEHGQKGNPFWGIRESRRCPVVVHQFESHQMEGGQSTGTRRVACLSQVEK